MVVAVTVTALAAPFLAVIDKALVERTTAASTTSTATLKNRITVWTSMYQTSVTILQQPVKFVKSPTFLWMWGTFAATYTAANTLRTILAFETTTTTRSHTPPAAPAPTSAPTNRIHHNETSYQYYTSHHYLPSAGTTLLMGTFMVNSTASILKDRAYAQLYGATTTSMTVPTVTYGLWGCRDMTVMGAAFVLPQYVAQFWMQQQQQHNRQNHWSEATIRRISQIATPVVAQVIAGPLHFVGYDCYNHHNTLHQRGSSGNLSLWSSSYQFWSDRWRNLRSSVGQVICARMLRIVPGYGIAGICNTELLAQWQQYIVQPLMDDDKKFGYRPTNNHNDDRNDGRTNANNTAVWDQHHHAQRC